MAKQDLIFIDMLGQRKLNEDAVDFRVFVELVDQCQQVVLRWCRRAGDFVAVDADFFAGLFFGGDIGFGGRVFADQDYRQAGRDAFGFQLGDFLPLIRPASVRRSAFPSIIFAVILFS